MSILPPLSSSSFTREQLSQVLTSGRITAPHIHLLRWLIWFPLLSVEELTSLEHTRRSSEELGRSPQRIAAQLQELETHQLVCHLTVNEPGWPSHQHRYALTDAGLYVFAALAHPPLSVVRLAQAYAVERADLIERLAHIDRHLVLAHFSTRLISEGQADGYVLVSYQQPWTQRDTIFGHHQTTRCDAAFLLATPQGTEHAFYVRVDTNERHPFNSKREQTLLVKLLNVRHALRLQQEAMPPLLILTNSSRLAEWAQILEKISAQRATALLDGAITTLDQLREHGVYGRAWWSSRDLVEGIDKGALTTLTNPSRTFAQVIGPPASMALSERFSQRQSFAHLLTERQHDPLRTTTRRLIAYVGKPLTQELSALHGPTLADALRGTRTEQQEATALLNLALSATQKDVVFWLTHHQLLTVHDLATLHYPGARDIRSTQNQLRGLLPLNFLVPFSWYAASSWQERERYVLAEGALRYSALREDRQVTYYLLPEELKKKYRVTGLALQRGTAGLFAQMHHTHGLYSSMGHLVLDASHEKKITIISWKSAREAVRWYRDPFTDTLMQIRPDAAIVYQITGEVLPRTLFIEYDRATTSRREYEAKYQSYTDYQEVTQQRLPPILVITQDEQAASRIRACVDDVGKHLCILIVLEEQLQRPGMMALLTLLRPSS